MKKTVLVIDDEPNARAGLRSVLHDMGCTVLEAPNGTEGLLRFKENKVNLVLTDLRMPGPSGMTILETLQKEAPGIPVVLITAYGTGDAAREALQKGAYDFISKPFGLETIELVIRRALKMVDLAHENQSLKKRIISSDGINSIVGESPQIQRVFEIIRQVAPTRSNVLIDGESGTGKELIARAVHDLSSRADQSFIPIHCASIPETLLESELFGHEKGAFTGAINRRSGRFEMADGGTLFLDEVSTIPLTVQVKLLRVLQERRFERVGGNETVEVDVRIIAATNTSLEEMIKQGTFRDDLYYRLNVVTLKVPPLRKRRTDIKALIKHFLEKFNKETGKKVVISKVAEEILESYDWPGNVRELQNSIEAFVVLCEGHEITPRDLPAHILGKTEQRSVPQPAGDAPDFDAMTLQQMEKWLILRKLDQIKTRSEAAKQLGISRRNLYRLLKEYGVME